VANRAEGCDNSVLISERTKGLRPAATGSSERQKSEVVMGLGFNRQRVMRFALSVFCFVVGGAEVARAQVACNLEYMALPPENLTNPGNRAVVGDQVQYSFTLEAGVINPGTQIQVGTVAFSLACEVGGFIVPGCPNDGGSIAYAGDATIVTDCVDEFGGPVVASTNNPGGGSDEFTLSFTPSVLLLEGGAACNLMLAGNVVSLSGDATPLMSEGASGTPTGGAVCTDPGNGLNASALNSFSVDLQAACPLQLEKCVVIDSAGDGFGNDPCLPADSGLDGTDVEWRIAVTSGGNGIPGDCVVDDPDLGFTSAPFDLAVQPVSFAIPGVCGDTTEGTNTATVECNLCTGLADFNTASDSATLTCNPPAMMPATSPWGTAVLAGMLLAALSLFVVWRSEVNA
jgi:hypothetical protein